MTTMTTMTITTTNDNRYQILLLWLLTLSRVAQWTGLRRRKSIVDIAVIVVIVVIVTVVIDVIVVVVNIVVIVVNVVVKLLTCWLWSVDP